MSPASTRRRTSAFRPSEPFNGLPRLPPRADVETRRVLKACIGARAALAELNAATGLLPNPSVLINTIPVLEARASSEIENIVTTTDRLFRFAGTEDHEGDEKADPATKEALRYQTALNWGYRSLGKKPSSTSTAVTVCQTILATTAGIRKVPGTALTNQQTGKVVYTPPVGEAAIRDLLSNWERYVHADDGVDPLVRMAVAHYQFEAIHPFSDGNGRTGRVLNLLFLVEQGLLSLPVLYLSRAIIRQKADYYRLLLDVTARSAWEPWVVYLVHAVEETARWTTAKIRSMRALMDATAEQVQARAPKLYSHELVELTFVQPYCRIANVVNAGLAKRQAASGYLKKLCEIDVLDEITAGREKLFVNRRLLELLASEGHHPPTTFASLKKSAGIGRRRRQTN